LSLDDFGSGYSSLSYLDRMPFDELKIDRAFVRQAPGDRQRENLLKGIIGLGKGLRLSIVVEGAEAADEVSFVEKLGVTAVQGYYYTRPVPARDVAQTLDDIAQRVKDQKQAA
jgi:EAL domain-containing protein (putative c-di-GMP-specific phosphodiesterase class I)